MYFFLPSIGIYTQFLSFKKNEKKKYYLLFSYKLNSSFSLPGSLWSADSDGDVTAVPNLDAKVFYKRLF